MNPTGPLPSLFITKLTSIISEAKEQDKLREGRMDSQPYHGRRKYR